MARASQIFADDLTVGFAFSGKATTLSSEHFSKFAALTGDSHPIHYDLDFAAKTKFGRPLAHGLLLTALTAMGATSFSSTLEDAMIALVEQRMNFIRPAFEGDVVTPRFEVVSNEPSARGRHSVVEFAVTLLNQDGERILEGRHFYLLRRSET